jgi:PAP2 superfamily
MSATTVPVRLPVSKVAALRRSPLGWMLEVVLLAALYLGSEVSRGLARGGAEVAERHAAAVVRVERHLHVFGEVAIQRAVHHVYGLPAILGYAYLTVHLTITVAVLAWVYRRRRHAYPLLRNTLALASLLAVVGYALYPTAPSRLAGVGIADTVSGATSINLGSKLVSSLYNPYAAIPSMHIGFSLLVGAAIWRLARRRIWRVAGVLYPLAVLFVIVATGNHFFLDAAAGAVVAAVAVALTTAAAAVRRRGRPEVRVAALPNACPPYPAARTPQAA